MRTLSDITDAARRGEPVTEEELRLAVCAYDVFIAQLELEKDPKQLAKFFVAAESDPLTTRITRWSSPSIRLL